MGAVASIMKAATAVNGMKHTLYLLTDAEVQEDCANRMAQRRAIKYCIDNIFYSVPVNIQAIATPGHHMRSALITFDDKCEMLQESTREAYFYPESCLVDPEGNIIISPNRRDGLLKSTSQMRAIQEPRDIERKLIIEASALQQLHGPPAQPSPPSASRVKATEIEIAWDEPGELGALVTKYEVVYRAQPRTLNASARWKALATTDVLRGDLRVATAYDLSPYTAYEFKLRAKNICDWSAWSFVCVLRTAPSVPRRPQPPFAGTILPEVIGLFWLKPEGTHGSPVQAYELRMRVAGPNSTITEVPAQEDMQIQTGLRYQWTTIYTGAMRQYVACGLEPGTSYAFCLAAANAVGVSEYSDPVIFRTPTCVHSNDGYAPPQNAGLLRSGDLWLECWDPRNESIFYFNRATAARQSEAPPAWLEARRDQAQEHAHGAMEPVSLSLVTDDATRFRIKRFHFLKEIKSASCKSHMSQLPFLVDGKLPLMVRRSCLCADSMSALRSIPAPALRTKLRIQYEGEPGVDSGGLTKDWYLQLSKALRTNGYFRTTPKQDLELAEVPVNATLDDYRAIGRFLGKAIFDQQCVDLPLVPALYYALRGLVGGDEVKTADLDSDDANPSVLAAILDEVKSIDTEFHTSLLWILDNDPAELGTTFSVDNGVGGEIDLVQGGKDQPVTNENKTHYVFLVARWRARYRVAIEMDALISGFTELGITPELIRSFDNAEIGILLNGRIEIDIDEIRAFTVHRGDNFSTDHVVALWFWQFMHAATRHKRQLVLIFATGSNRVPLDGFDPPFTLTLNAEKTDALPTSHTCFNNLVLPLYTTYEVMRRQIELAINSATTFELA